MVQKSNTLAPPLGGAKGGANLLSKQNYILMLGDISDNVLVQAMFVAGDTPTGMSSATNMGEVFWLCVADQINTEPVMPC